ncbi:hypothetical protein SKAU_G00038010 [Synaphobranchus kaupii]|uniref:Uncharacterized protein n=1 Tax=Synaphobranchus kaupii TaxID=118154 RepID=A0A9Q1JF01_SYNKA|nr:hypothetical protein SKAU_G00038010 [Synaphobranchus kaupii]
MQADFSLTAHAVRIGRPDRDDSQLPANRTGYLPQLKLHKKRNPPGARLNTQRKAPQPPPPLPQTQEGGRAVTYGTMRCGGLLTVAYRDRIPQGLQTALSGGSCGR